MSKKKSKARNQSKNNTFDPQEEVKRYCKDICKSHIRVLRLDKDKGTWYWDYPAMVAVCHDIGCTQKRKSYSHRPDKTKFHKTLEKHLCKLGKIGGKSRTTNCKYLIGNCAEQHAANIYMNALNENNLNNLYFSEAMRPRTKEIFEYCDNCKKIFPNL